MDVRKLLEEVKRGDTSIEEAENAFKNLPYEDLGYAKLDLHRKLRSGFPETVFCQGKPDAYLADIFETLYRENGEVLGTRATPEQWNLVRARIPEIEYDPVSKILQARKSSETPWKLEALMSCAISLMFVHSATLPLTGTGSVGKRKLTGWLFMV